MATPRNFWTTDINEAVRIQTKCEDLNHYYEPRTVIKQFRQTANQYSMRPAMMYTNDLDSPYKTINWGQYEHQTNQIAQGLISAGLQPGQGVAIMGFNHPIWFMANIAAIKAGGVVAGIYTTNSQTMCKHILEDCNAAIAIVETDEHLSKIQQVAHLLPALKMIIQYRPPSEDLRTKIMDGSKRRPQSCTQPLIYTWDEFVQFSNLLDLTDEVEERISQLRPNKCCTLIYTSGTTGPPKGVMLSHDNILWTTATVLGQLGVNGSHPERVVSYLPLSHVAAQMVDLYMPIVTGSVTTFAQPSALKGTLKTTLLHTRPTIFLGVPRVWEKMMEAMQAQGQKASSIKRFIGNWAKGKGLARHFQKTLDNTGEHMRTRSTPTKPFAYNLANTVVFKKVKRALGLDQCRLHFTGAAPISHTVIEYFASLDIPIYDLYGMSECTGPMTVSQPDHWNHETSGQPFRGTGLRIDESALDTYQLRTGTYKQKTYPCGEICTMGRHVMMGYLNQSAKTQMTIDEDGWLHSGDIGFIDDEGYLHITGRLKELIVTAGGENVAPVPIEDQLKQLLPFVSNCMVIGDNRKFLSVLITLKCEMNPDTSAPTDTVAHNIEKDLYKLDCHHIKSVTKLAKQPNIHNAIEAALIQINNMAPSRAQRIQKYKILPTDFSIPGGELGPTLKLKRPVVMNKWADEISAMYT